MKNIFLCEAHEAWDIPVPMAHKERARVADPKHVLNIFLSAHGYHNMNRFLGVHWLYGYGCRKGCVSCL